MTAKFHAEEIGYRRGVAQAIYWAFDRIDECKTIEEARDLMDEACGIADDMRWSKEANSFYLDLLSAQLSEKMEQRRKQK